EPFSCRSRLPKRLDRLSSRLGGDSGACGAAASSAPRACMPAASSRMAVMRGKRDKGHDFNIVRSRSRVRSVGRAVGGPSECRAKHDIAGQFNGPGVVRWTRTTPGFAVKPLWGLLVRSRGAFDDGEPGFGAAVAEGHFFEVGAGFKLDRAEGL